MALRPTIAFFRFHLIDANLRRLSAFLNLRGNGSTGNNRRTDSGLVIIHHAKNLVKSDCSTVLCFELLNLDHIALCNTILLATGNNNGMLHWNILPLFRSRSQGGTGRSLKPFQCGAGNITLFH